MDMKKNLLLLTFLVFLISGASAQSFSFFDHNSNPIANGTMLEVLDLPSASEIVFEMNIQNSSDSEKIVMAKKNYIDVLADTYNMFCWGMCFGPDVFVSTTVDTLSVGEITYDGFFSGHYLPNAIEGYSIIQYVFFDVNNPNDSAYVNVKFIAGFTGVSDSENPYYISGVYPNPAVSVARLDYALNSVNEAVVFINDLTGTRVKEVILDHYRGSVFIDVSGLRRGVYFFTVVIDGAAVKTEKLVVK